VRKLTEEQTPQFYEAKTEWGMWTNTGSGGAYFSIKQRKFIKPFVEWGADTTFKYKLLPGKYILLIWSYWSRDDPPHTIQASLVQIQPSKYGGLEQKTLATSRWNITRNFKFSNEILDDFFNFRVRSYHGTPSPKFSKVYPQEQVDQLIQLIESRINFTEGEEVE
jgi:hypothetical protein